MRWVLVKKRRQGGPVSGVCKVTGKHCPHYSKSKYGDFCGDVNGVNDIDDICFHKLGWPRDTGKKVYTLTQAQQNKRKAWNITG